VLLKKIYRLLVICGVCFFTIDAVPTLADFNSHKTTGEGLQICSGNWRYLEFNGFPLNLVTCGYISNNLYEWFGDLDPVTIDCGLDLMAAHKMNHAYFILEMRDGQFDTPISSPFDYDPEVKWNTKFWHGLEETIAYANSVDIIVQIVIFSEALLEPYESRWDENVFNVSNGGPVPGEGHNFYLTEEPDGEPGTWNWKQWNAHYQDLFIEKVLSTAGENCNVILNPCWEINFAEWGLDWFIDIVQTIRKMEESFYPHLICVCPIQPDAFCELECADLIMIENRGIASEFLDFQKPVIQGGPWAKNTVSEPEFMLTCACYGEHPSTNLINGPPEESDGFDYCLRLQTFMENVRSWEDEPGNEIWWTNLPSHTILSGDCPELLWSGEKGFDTDGVNPNEGFSNTSFDFRVTYRDVNNDPPAVAEIWIDVNQDQLFQFDERQPLEEITGESDYSVGVTYGIEGLKFDTDGQIGYRFNFADEEWWPAEGKPIEETKHFTICKIFNP
jgi:hypothetical protein